MTAGTAAETAGGNKPPEAGRGSRGRGRSGPPLWIPALAFAALMIVSVVLARQMPQPTASAAEALAYYRDHETAARVAGVLQFGAAFPLAVWSAVVYTRLRLLGVTAPGPAIALAGGVVSAVAMALCGVLGWAASRSGSLQSPALARTLADLVFATGGPAHVVAFGLLLAGVAVPALLVRLVPAVFAWSGIALAAVAVLGTLALLDTSLGIVLPIARFGGLIWLVAASVMLPREHRRRNRPQPTGPAGVGAASA